MKDKKALLRKVNCWEIKLCGRQPGGTKANEIGICKVALETSFNKINDGVNGGRYCWNIKDSLCEYHHFGTFSENSKICQSCDFKKLVKREEGFQYIE